MDSRPPFAVAVATLVLFAGVGSVVGVGPAGSVAADAPERVADGPVHRSGDALAQYKVSLDNVTIETWLVRNSTVVNVTIQNVVVRNATTTDGRTTNVTLSNVTVGRFILERARLKNVTAERLVVRNKSVLNIPGGGFIDPDVENRTIERHWTKNLTVSGVVIDQMTVDAAILCGNATLGQQATDAASFDPTASENDPDITVENGTVGEALIIKGGATNWSVQSVQQPTPSNATLPKGCSRG
ncbi:hypothetical protein [Halorussus sp. MSC15.2]|uniref:hypothetical protein n=1 Tax=Halorussus sp. MSC15.2 TaxID=2283638 RepID=UPI0013D40F58|nr:hypothetical protein [Halorussus sp. MSC15.2]NEU57179.1 hypothetical protein [Halorussus sp. MSC15.2]